MSGPSVNLPVDTLKKVPRSQLRPRLLLLLHSPSKEKGSLSSITGVQGEKALFPISLLRTCPWMKRIAVHVTDEEEEEGGLRIVTDFSSLGLWKFTKRKSGSSPKRKFTNAVNRIRKFTNKIRKFTKNAFWSCEALTYSNTGPTRHISTKGDMSTL